MFGQVGFHDPGTVVDLCLVPENRQRPADVIAELTQERDGVLAMSISAQAATNRKYSPSCLRLGLIVTALMAEMRSCRSQVFKIGVWPRGAKVRRTVGVSMNPLSSRKTKSALRRRARWSILGSF